MAATTTAIKHTGHICSLPHTVVSIGEEVICACGRAFRAVWEDLSAWDEPEMAPVLLAQVQS
jgi:hypothetical protein